MVDEAADGHLRADTHTSKGKADTHTGEQAVKQAPTQQQLHVTATHVSLEETSCFAL